MNRSNPVWTASCGREHTPDSVAARCTFICYLLLAVGIWIAFLWLIFAGAMAPAAAHLPESAFSRPIPVSGPIVNEAGVADEQSFASEATDLDKSVVVGTRVPLVMSTPAANLLSFEKAGYMARKQLIAELQNALITANCLRGTSTGRWDVQTREALSAFLASANARLPVGKPDDALFHFVKYHSLVTCHGNSVLRRPPHALSLQSASRPGKPAGLMGIGAPRSELETSSISIVSAATSSEYTGANNIEPESRRNGGKRASSSQPGHSTQGQRSVRDLLLHPLGTY